MTSYELTHFKKMVRVWKTKSLLFCLRYDPLIVFLKAKSYNFHFHENDVTWPLSANGLLSLTKGMISGSVVYLACLEVWWFYDSSYGQRKRMLIYSTFASRNSWTPHSLNAADNRRANQRVVCITGKFNWVAINKRIFSPPSILRDSRIPASS